MRRPTLRRRLTTLTAAAVAIAVVGVSLAAWLLLRLEMRNEVAGDLGQQADDISQHYDPTKLASPPAWARSDVSTLFGVVEPSGHSRHPHFQSLTLPVTETDVEVALGDSPPVMRDVTIHHVHYMMITQHSVRGDAVQLAADMTDQDDTLTHFAVLLLGADAVAIVVAAALGYGLTVAGLQPVHRVASAAAHVAATQDLHAAVPISPHETAEVASVAASVNQMLTALGMSREAQRQLVDDASHELATPLTSLRTNVNLLLRAERNPERQLSGADRQRLLTDIEAQMGELDQLIEEVVDVARDPGYGEEITELDLADVVRAAVTRARARTPEVTFALTEQSVPIIGKRGSLERAVLNLLDNAAKWNPPGEPVYVDIQRLAGLASITVTDRGPGVPDADLERVFERFHRTDDARALPGSGLGLAIVRQVVLSHGGHAWLSRRVEGGTVAHIAMPA
jgi:two-component system sensor histidine kinase MprB